MRPLLPRLARCAALVLLVLWVGPVTFVHSGAGLAPRWSAGPGAASAGARVTADAEAIPAGRAMLLEPDTPLKLRMRDGTTIEGRYVERTLLDSATYAARFQAKSRAAPFAPIAWGETLHVVLRDGRGWRLPFAGYAEKALLLSGPGAAEYVRVPFEFTSEIRRADGEDLAVRPIARAYRANQLPSAEALVIATLEPAADNEDASASELVVPIEEVQSVFAPRGAGDSEAAMLALGIVAGVAVVALMIQSSQGGVDDGCGSVPVYTWFSPPPEIPTTPRPFDLERGCYVGDALAVDTIEPAPVAPPVSSAAASAQTASYRRTLGAPVP